MNIKPHQKELEHRLATLTRRLEAIQRDISHSYNKDSAEQAQERENDEVLMEIGATTQASIDAIEAAITRIERGIYGNCCNCHDSIDVERLSVMPEARECRGCANKAENRITTSTVM